MEHARGLKFEVLNLICKRTNHNQPLSSSSSHRIDKFSNHDFSFLRKVLDALSHFINYSLKRKRLAIGSIQVLSYNEFMLIMHPMNHPGWIIRDLLIWNVDSRRRRLVPIASLRLAVTSNWGASRLIALIRAVKMAITKINLVDALLSIQTAKMVGQARAAIDCGQERTWLSWGLNDASERTRLRRMVSYFFSSSQSPQSL